MFFNVDIVKNWINYWIFGITAQTPFWYAYTYELVDTAAIKHFWEWTMTNAKTGYVPALIVITAIVIGIIYWIITAIRNAFKSGKMPDKNVNNPSNNNTIFISNVPATIDQMTSQVQSQQQSRPVTPIQESTKWQASRNPTPVTSRRVSFSDNMDGNLIKSSNDPEDKQQKTTTGDNSINQTLVDTLLKLCQAQSQCITSNNVSNINSNMHVSTSILFNRKTDSKAWNHSLERFMDVKNTPSSTRVDTMWSYINEECSKTLRKLQYSEDKETAYEELKQNMILIFDSHVETAADMLNKFNSRRQKND